MEPQNQLGNLVNQEIVEQNALNNGKDRFNKMAIIVRAFLLCVFVIIGIIVLSTNGVQYSDIDSQFKDYILSNYDIRVNEDGYINKCLEGCDYFGFYNVGDDYNYAIQIEKTGDNFEVSVDKNAMELRKKLYDYIIDMRNSDIAPNYLGYYKNTESGVVAYSSIESQQLYYIVKYNNEMNLEDELRKDYWILQKAQELASEKALIKEMNVLYIEDSRLNDDDWIKKLGLDIRRYGDVVYNSSDFLNDFKYHYRISNYGSDSSLASVTIDDFLVLAKNKLETN